MTSQSTPVNDTADPESLSHSAPNTIARPAIFEVALIVALGLVAAVLRFYRLGSESFWRDELIQVTLAQRTDSLWQTLLVFADTNRGNAPLDYLISHIMLNISQDEAILRIPAALFGALTVILLYFTGKKLFTPAAGFLAALLLAVMQLHIYYSQEMRPYSLSTFLILLTFYLFIQSISTNKKWLWAALTIAAALALYAHFYTLLIIMALGLWTLVRRRDRLIPLIISLGLSVALFLPWFYYDIIREGAVNTRPETFDIAAVIPGIMAGLTIGQGTPCTNLCMSLNARANLVAAVLILALFALLKSKGRLRGSMLLVLVVLAVGLSGTLLLDHFGQYFFAVRQILVWVPYFMLLTGSLLLLVPKRLTPYAVLLAGLFFITISYQPLSSLYADQTKEDFRGAAVFLRENMAPDDLLFVKNPDFLTYYDPDLDQKIYAGPEKADQIRARLIDQSQNGDNVWFVFWGQNPNAYGEALVGIRRRGEKVFDRPRVIFIPPARQ